MKITEAEEIIINEVSKHFSKELVDAFVKSGRIDEEAEDLMCEFQLDEVEEVKEHLHQMIEGFKESKCLEIFATYMQVIKDHSLNSNEYCFDFIYDENNEAYDALVLKQLIEDERVVFVKMYDNEYYYKVK